MPQMQYRGNTTDVYIEFKREFHTTSNRNAKPNSSTCEKCSKVTVSGNGNSRSKKWTVEGGQYRFPRLWKVECKEK